MTTYQSFPPTSANSEPLDLVLIKSSEHTDPIIHETLYLRKKIHLSQLNLSLVHSNNIFEVKIKPNSQEILSLLMTTFSEGGLWCNGLSKFALLLGSLLDDHLLFVVYGLMNETSKKMQLRAMQLCSFGQVIVGLLWQAQNQKECEDPLCTQAFKTYLSQLDSLSNENHPLLNLQKTQSQTVEKTLETCVKLSQPPLSSSSVSSSQTNLPPSSNESSTNISKTDYYRRNRDLIKYVIKRQLQKHGIHSKHPDYLAKHKLLYENCKFRLRKELEVNEKLVTSLILETVQAEYKRNQALVNGP